MKWKKEKPIKGGFGGCLHCGYQYDIAPEEMLIAVGFGIATVTKNGKEIYNENSIENESDLWTLKEAEEEALKDEDNDWRIHLVAPLSERHYQRQDKNKWYFMKKVKDLHRKIREE